MTSIPITEARASLAEIIQRAAMGEEIVITSHGVAKAKVVAAETSDRPRTFTPDQLRGIVHGGQMDAGAWDDINAGPGGTIQEDGLG